LRGNLTIIAISTVLLLGYTGFNTAPVFGGGGTDCSLFFDICFDGGPGGTGQDWNTAVNWDPDIEPFDNSDIGIGYDTVDINPVFFDVIITSPNLVFIDFAGGGRLEINTGSTLTVENGADFDHLSGDTIVVHTGAEIFVDGNMFNGDGGTMTIDGKVTVGDTGLFTNDLSFIDGNGEIECIGNGTFDQLGTVAGTVTVTGCGGAAVGSISIPID